MKTKPGMYDTFPHAIRGILNAFGLMTAIVLVVGGATWATCEAFGQIPVCSQHPEATAAMIVCGAFIAAFAAIAGRASTRGDKAKSLAIVAVFGLLFVRAALTLAGI